MWTIKMINWITNLFGAVGGVPQILDSVVKFQEGDYGHAVQSLCMGIGILAVGYFTGKSTLSKMEDPSQKPI